MKINVTIFCIYLFLISSFIKAESISNQTDSFNHVSITTNNIQKLLDFYQKVIGCKLLPNGGERSGDGISEGIGLKNAKLLNYKLQFPNSDIILEIIQMQSPSAAIDNKDKINSTGYTHFCLIVKNIDETYKILKDNGVKTISPPVTVAQTNAKFFYAYDPDSNIIEIVQNPPKNIELNYDENKVPSYTLPDPLVMDNGTKVTSAKLWNTRRAEILKLFKDYVYGELPPFNGKIEYKVVTADDNALGGIAIKKQAQVIIGGKVKLNLLMYFPKEGHKPYPSFIGYNFCGNQAVSADTDIFIDPNWANKDICSKPTDPKDAIVNDKFTESSRGIRAYRYPLKDIISNGYAFVTCYYGDVYPDYNDGFRNGIFELFPNATAEQKKNFSAISAWSAGLSYILDAIEANEPLVDKNKVIVFGHSRLGKTALWAGATDTRFAMVISNDSGCGGAALSKRKYGETLQSINTQFPHWFNSKFKEYNNKEEELPLDQHMLISLIAPRPVYVASAEDDKWADPKGEFLSAKAADPVYRLLTGEGLNITSMPPVNTPSIGIISYHIRTGAHELTKYDWEQYIKTANKFFKDR